MRRPFPLLPVLVLAASGARAELPPGPSLARPMPFFQSLAVRPPPPFRVGPGATPGVQCRMAIQAAERAAGIPAQLMAAIGRVESGRRDSDGVVNPWPWSINAEGEDHVFDSKAEAIAAVLALQARGVRSIDVGCMQVNLLHHPTAFASLDLAFDPVANATYAARFLTELFAQTGNWQKATAWYHSATPDLGDAYQRKVASVWPEEQRRGPAPLVLAPGPNLPAPPGAFPAGGGFMLSNSVAAARLVPAPSGMPTGRSLAAYRAAPIAVARSRL